MARQRPLSDDGLDYLESPKRPKRKGPRGRGTARPRSTQPAKAGNLQRRKFTVHISEDLMERVKNAAYWNPRLTISSIVDAGLRFAIAEIETENGGPYPEREEELRGGRPLKT